MAFLSTPRARLWAAIVVALALLLGAGMFYATKREHPVIPPGLVEKRAATAKILDQSNAAEDIDIKPLVDLEAKKDYAGAVLLMTRALAANQIHGEFTAALAITADDLTKLATQVKPDSIGAQAVDAFGLLVKFAAADKKYYADRHMLYQMTYDYYSELAAKKSPPIPDNLKDVVNTVTTDLAAVNDLRNQFVIAIKAFDAAAGIK